MTLHTPASHRRCASSWPGRDEGIGLIFSFSPSF